MTFRNRLTTFKLQPVRLLLVAALFHVLLTTAVFVVGRKQLMPSAFDVNGTAISIAPDAVEFLKDAQILGDSLRQGHLNDWIRAQYSFHLKVYSISFAILDPLIGANVLTAEPVNALLYVGILILVFKLTTITLNRDAGLIASFIVGVWPSLLIHTTQLVKDALFILEIVGLIFVLARLVSKTYSNREWLVDVVVGAALGILLRKTRPDLASVIVAILLLAGLMLTARELQLRKLLVPNSIGLTIILVITVCGILLLSVSRLENHPRLGFKHGVRHTPELRWWQWTERIGELRDGFIQDSSPGSNIDTDFRINNATDLVRYLPRATAIGLFAPFPSMWVEEGKTVGSLFRRISGAETMLMYAIELLALVAVWRNRRKLLVWFLTSIAALGVVSLGLVVINIGTLYRQRYSFLILIMILGAGEISHCLQTFRVGVNTKGLRELD